MLTNTLAFSLKKPLMKVHRFMPAIDNSIVLLYLVTLGKDAIMHINSKNEPVFTHAFNDMVDTLGMLNEREAIVLLVSKNKIFILDLVTHTFKLYNHFYKIDISCQVKLQTFYKTKMLCICQNGTYNHHVLKLTYYAYPLPQSGVSGECKPQAVFQAQEGDWTYEYTIRKGNSHSMILWFKSRHDDEFQIKTFDLRNDPRGVYRVLKIKNMLGDPYGIDKINCALQQLWEMRPNCFCLVATTDKTEKKYTNANGSNINNFIWDVDSSTISQAPFQLPARYSHLQIDSLSCGQYSMFRSFSFQQGKPLDSPAIFVSNYSLEVQAREVGKCTFQSNWQVPGYSDCLFAEGRYDNYGVNDITVVTRQLLSRKMLSLHLIMQSEYQCLDVDMLEDVISLLDYQP